MLKKCTKWLFIKSNPALVKRDQNWAWKSLTAKPACGILNFRQNSCFKAFINIFFRCFFFLEINTTEWKQPNFINLSSPKGNNNAHKPRWLVALGFSRNKNRGRIFYSNARVELASECGAKCVCVCRPSSPMCVLNTLQPKEKRGETWVTWRAGTSTS